jgi:hypothetical protein
VNYSFEKAVRYISDSIVQGEGKDIFQLIQTASEKFDLTPSESQQLIEIHRAEIKKVDHNVT